MLRAVCRVLGLGSNPSPPLGRVTRVEPQMLLPMCVGCNSQPSIPEPRDLPWPVEPSEGPASKGLERLGSAPGVCLQDHRPRQPGPELTRP